MSYNQPDKHGKFGQFGGQYVAESLMPAVLELEKAYEQAKNDSEFQKEFAYFTFMFELLNTVRKCLTHINISTF